MSLTNTFFTLLCLVMMIHGESILRRNQRFIADEPLDFIDRDNYHDLIQSIWGGVVRSSPIQINNKCVDIVNTVLDNVMECSRRIVTTLELIEKIFSLVLPIRMTKAIYKSFKKLIKQWMEDSLKDITYGMCLNVAKSIWRSPIEIALLDL